MDITINDKQRKQVAEHLRLIVKEQGWIRSHVNAVENIIFPENCSNADSSTTPEDPNQLSILDVCRDES
jgi:hypothetical protein